MMGAFFVRGLLIGLFFGVPAGAVGAMTIHRSLQKGMWAGLLTGLGSSAADSLYAVVGAFGLTAISDLLLQYQTIIQLLGGSLILYMGILMILRKDRKEETAPDGEGFQMFLSAFAVGITNPAAILTFIFAFSWFGISGEMGTVQRMLLVCGVFTGTYFWWILLSVAAEKFRYRTGEVGLHRINQVLGIILCLFALVIFGKMLF